MGYFLYVLEAISVLLTLFRGQGGFFRFEVIAFSVHIYIMMMKMMCTHVPDEISVKLMVMCLCLCVCVCVVRALWSDTSPVAVERRYVEHVAVSANSHRFHLTISRQRG